MADTDKATDGGEGSLDFTGKLLILLSGVLSALCLTAINSVLPSIDKALAHGPTDSMLVKQLFGGVAMAMAVGAPLGGFLADKLGLRRTLFGASVIYVVAGTAGLYLSSLPILLVSRLLLGLAAATIQVLGLTMVNTQLSGNTRARWMGLHVSVAIFGTLFIHPIAGQLGEISWRLPFALYAGGAVLIVGLLLDSVGKAAAVAPVKAEAKAAKAAGPGIISWFPWHYLLLSILIGAVTFLPTVSIPFQLGQQHKATPSTIAYVMTGASLLGGIMALLYGRARLVLSVHAAFVMGFGLAGLGALIAAYSTSFGVLLVGLVFHSIGVAWFVPNIMTSLGTKVKQDQQGRAAGLVKMAHFVAAPLCVALVQPYVKAYGEVIAMKVVAVIGITMFVVMLVRMVTSGKVESVAGGVALH